jgi:hypothetical protein
MFKPRISSVDPATVKDPAMAAEIETETLAQSKQAADYWAKLNDKTKANPPQQAAA